jgi:hypothetical protein
LFITIVFIYAAGAYVVWDFYDTAKRKKRKPIQWAIIGGATYMAVVIIFPRLVLIPIYLAFAGENSDFGQAVMWVTIGHLITIGVAWGSSLWVLNKFLARKSKVT